MTRMIGILLACLFAATTPVSAVLAAATEGPFVLKLGTLAPKGSPWYRFIREMADEWESASGGAIEVRIYPGGSIGDERDMVRKMAIGQLHGASLTGEGLSAIVPELLVFQLPMLMRNDGELGYVRRQLAPELESLFADAGYHVLNWGDAGWVRFFTRTPAVDPDDLRSMKLFVWAGDPPTYQAYRKAGYDPVALPITELHTALKSGMVDAFSVTPVAALSFQWFGQAPNMIDVNWAPLIGATILTQAAWRRIPATMRPVVKKTARSAGDRSQVAIRRFEREAIEVMKSHGLAIHKPSPDMLDEWESRARAGWPTLSGGRVPPDLLRRVERLRDTYRQVAGGG